MSDLPVSVPVQIELPVSTLRQVDALVAARPELSRSQVVQEALDRYIEQERRSCQRRMLAQGYAQMAELNLRLAQESASAEDNALVLAAEGPRGAQTGASTQEQAPSSGRAPSHCVTPSAAQPQEAVQPETLPTDQGWPRGQGGAKGQERSR